MSSNDLERGGALAPLDDPMAESRWAEICAREVAWTMEAARQGVPSFVEYELRPLGKNLLRSVNLTLAARDLYRIAHHLGEIFLGPREPGPLVLASEEQLARAFSRWCLGPESLNLFLAETFGFLHDALTRKKGEDYADVRITAAVRRFAPVRLEVLRRLAVGPRVVRVLSGPTAHMAVPALWAAASVAVGQRRTEAALAEREFADRVKEAMGTQVQPAGALPGPLLMALGGLAMVAGSAATATAGYRMLDMPTRYIRLLEDAEYLLLDGYGLDDPEPWGMGLLEVVARLELDMPL